MWRRSQVYNPHEQVARAHGLSQDYLYWDGGNWWYVWMCVYRYKMINTNLLCGLERLQRIKVIQETFVFLRVFLHTGTQGNKETKLFGGDLKKLNIV